MDEQNRAMQAMGPREQSSQDRIITLLLTIDSDRTISFVRHTTLLEAENTRLKEELQAARHILHSLIDREHRYDV